MTDADGADHPPPKRVDEGPNRTTYQYLNQGLFWIPKDQPPVPIREMELEWRLNAARFLERRAGALELRYTMGELSALGAKTLRSVIGEQDGKPVEGGQRFSHLEIMGDHALDAFDAELEQRVYDPVAWLRTTALYRALVAGLPTDPGELGALSERARHYSTCPGRRGEKECTCQPVTGVGRPPPG